MEFEELELIQPILRAVREEGYFEPSPIQRKAIPPALDGRDLLGCAQTGTGKTAAFAIPILQRLTLAGPQGRQRPIRALVLTPTRELALQVAENFRAYGRYLRLRTEVIFGGVSQNPQGYVQLNRVETLVLDEADRMLDMGFIRDVERIIRKLPSARQTLFFSATMPDSILKLCEKILTNPVRVAVTPVSSAVDVIEQKLYFVDKANKRRLLIHLLQTEQIPSALVFTFTKHGADRVVRELAKAKIPARAIHGDKSQNSRQTALNAFKAGEIRVLVATDIAARGIDIEELPYVFNYDLPNIPETYVHRIGRTGRAGQRGTAVSFCCFAEKESLAGIEKLTRKPIPVVEEHPYPMQVFEIPPKQPRPPRAVQQDSVADKQKKQPQAEKKMQKKPPSARGRTQNRPRGGRSR